jgi:hypothetical protein
MAKSRRQFLKVSAAFAGFFAVAPVRAVIEYPTKPIKIIAAAATDAGGNMNSIEAAERRANYGQHAKCPRPNDFHSSDR